MKTNLTLALAATFGYAFLFSACESKEEKDRKAAIEQKADALEQQGKDMKKEAKAEAKATEKQAEANADATKKAGENNADAIKDAGDAAKKEKENEADKLRDQK